MGLSSVVIIKGRHTRSRLLDTIGFPSLIMAIIHKRTLEPLSVGGHTRHPQAPDMLYVYFSCSRHLTLRLPVFKKDNTKSRLN